MILGIRPTPAPVPEGESARTGDSDEFDKPNSLEAKVVHTPGSVIIFLLKV